MGTHATTAPWTYADLPADRIERLLAAPSFDDIVAQVVATGHDVCIHREACHDTEGRHMRYLLTLRVPPEVFDAFFNSPNGYRAQFHQSVQQGKDANARMLRQLSMHFRPKNRAPGALDVSITAESASAWLCEAGTGLCPYCDGEWSAGMTRHHEPQILGTHWPQEGDAGLWAHGAFGGSRIQLVGAFVDAAGCQYIAPHKTDRHEAIHRTGWI